MRKKSSSFKYLIIIFILFIIGAYLYFQLLTSAVSSNNESRIFTINPGESTSEIAQSLENNGFIRSSLAFKVLLKLTSQVGTIQAGDFKISPSMSMKDIISNLQLGTIDQAITFPEGLRVEEMADKLNQNLGIDKKEFIKESKEGYMFPDTYKFNKNQTVSEIVKIMRDNFDNKFSSDIKQKTSKLGLTSDQTVILASIVEREAKSETDKQQVASILLNRLNQGMALDTDATSQYALGFQSSTNSWWKKITPEDLKINSPYNTYINQGLPPTPICNPGLVSLQAVAAADPNTPYLYYYHDSKGVAHYAKTLDDHNQNIQNYP